MRIHDWHRRWQQFHKGLGGGSNFTYLIRDEFLTNAAAPLTSPRNCEPTGVLAIVDTLNALSISGGEVVSSNLSTSSDNPSFSHTAGFARVSGRTLKTRIKNVSAFGSDVNKTFSPCVSWNDVISSTNIIDFEGISYWIANSRFQVLDSINTTSWITVESCFADTYNVFAIIQRAGGGVFNIVDGKLIGITRQNTAATPHAHVSTVGTNRNPFQLDYIRVADLPAPWNTDFGICTSALAGARVAADAFTHEGSGHLEFTITTLPSAGNVLVHFRKIDNNNCYRVLFDNTGVVALYEVVAGVQTVKASIGGCLANDRIVVSFNGATIAIYRDRPATGVTNSTLLTTAIYGTQTAGEVNSLGTGGAISDLYTYPYNLSGTALALVNAL